MQAMGAGHEQPRTKPAHAAGSDRTPVRLVVAFLAVLLLPAATLVALGLRWLEQDRALQLRRRMETIESAADRAARAIELDLATLLRELKAGPHPPAGAPWPGAVALTLD